MFVEVVLTEARERAEALSDALLEAGALSAEDRDSLDESFHLLWQIRLEHQCQQFRDGVPVDDFVDPRELGPITRRALREAFRSIAGVQRSMVTEFGLRVR